MGPGETLRAGRPRGPCGGAERRLLATFVALGIVACGGGASPEAPSVAHYHARTEARPIDAGSFAIEPISSPPSAAPLDAEVSHLEGARAVWLGPVGERVYALTVPSRRETAAPPVVLVHGLGTAGVRDFYPVLRILSEKREVVALDLPGLGRSELGARQPSPAVFASVVASTVAALTEGPFDLVGHSLGGNVAITAAGHPDFNPRRLVLVDVAGVLHRQAFAAAQIEAGAGLVGTAHDGLGGVVSGIGSRIVEASSVFDPGNDSVENPGGLSPQTRAALALVLHDISPALEAIRVPTLLLWGDQDRIAPLRTAALLRDRIRGARLLLFEGVGHVPMEVAPAAWAQAVDEFLDAQEVSAPSSEGPGPSAQRVGRIDCRGEGIEPLSGSYARLSLSNCEDVTIEGAQIGRLELVNTKVRLVAVRVEDGIFARDAVLVATGGSFRGNVALYLVDSEADLAGTVVMGRTAAIASQDGARLLLSAVRVKSPHNDGSIHDQIDLKEGEAL